jgi:hypothetical protein
MTYQFDYTLSLNLASASVVIRKVAPVPKLHTKLYIYGVANSTHFKPQN